MPSICIQYVIAVSDMSVVWSGVCVFSYTCHTSICIQYVFARKWHVSCMILCACVFHLLNMHSLWLQYLLARKLHVCYMIMCGFPICHTFNMITICLWRKLHVCYMIMYVYLFKVWRSNIGSAACPERRPARSMDARTTEKQRGLLKLGTV